MKNLKYYMFLAAAMLFTGCSQDEEFIDDLVPGTQNKLVDITIGTPQEHNSRVSYDDTATPFAWENGDEVITVGFAEDGTYKGQAVFRMKDELTDDKKTATFTGALPEGAKQYKVYYKAANLTIATADGSPKVDYGTQSADITSAETQTAHMKNFYQLATPKLTLENLLDPAAPKNLKLENSLLRLDVKSYPAAIGTLKNMFFRTNIAKGTTQFINIGITNVPAEQKGFKVFMLFDPIVMAQTEGETFEVVFVGDKGAQAISKDNTKATFNKPGSRYNLIAYQDDLEIQDASTSAVLKNWAVWEGASVDSIQHTITTKWAGFITTEMVNEALGDISKNHALKVVGHINGRDIKPIREAAGCMFDNSVSKTGYSPLRFLYLQDAIIEGSDDVYAEDAQGAYHTEDNKISTRMFTKSALQKIVLPEGITLFDNDAFNDSFLLTVINIPSTVTTFKTGVFAGSQKLETIEIPDNVTTIGNNAFELCKSLKYVKLPNNLDYMSAQMFSRCSSLKTITIPAAVKRIAAEVFKETILDTLNIPVNVEYIGARLIEKVTTLKSLTIENPSAELAKTFSGFTASENCDLTIPRVWDYRVSQSPEGKSMFEGLAWKSIKFIGDEQVEVDIDAVNHTITTKSAGHIVPKMISTAIGTGNDHKLVVKGEINGADIKAIREAAGCNYDNSQSSSQTLSKVALQHLDLSGATFKASEDFYAKDQYKTEDNKISEKMFVYSGLRSVVLPEGITEIGNYAFRGSKLESVNIPNTVTTLRNSSFYECLSLKSIVIPNSVTTVEGNVFSDCRQLASVKLSEKMSEIGPHMFYRTKLTSVTIPASVTKINGWSFRESKLTSLVIPATVTYVDEYLLGSMTTLRTLTFEGAKTTYNTKDLHHIFKGYTDSGNCDLVIPAEWKSKVSTSAEGKFMFEGLAWKSIKDLKGNDLTVTSGK